ncbi:hypothetical protein HGI47_10875 [Novosphingobium sp. ERN07]|uniref:hypothetical protein n=1 Tax=Novosphingobium sp. ERN07 TaxID=2726187 RepID=UPI00145666E7|nr:hypothetical protein [Novosphingobium sp. ERN07]NLR71373.1 hypothetical protein [Novosphingobium sp. ERN07]
MSGSALLAVGAAVGLSGVGTLRLSWGAAQRSTLLNAIGWAMLVGALIAGWASAGAWGATVVSLWAMGAALALLAAAAWGDPSARGKASNRRAGMVPEPGEPRQVLRRVTTFCIVIIGGLAAAIALGVMTRWVALFAGADEADANVLAFFAVPLAWAILAFVLMMTDRRKRQLAMIAIPNFAAIPALISGSVM